MARYRDAAQRLVRSLIIAFAYSPTHCGRAPSFGGSSASRFTSGNGGVVLCRIRCRPCGKTADARATSCLDPQRIWGMNAPTALSSWCHIKREVNAADYFVARQCRARQHPDVSATKALNGHCRLNTQCSLGHTRKDRKVVAAFRADP